MKQTMKAIRYFLLRDIRTRPLQFLSSVLVAMSAITALMLMLLYTEAAWRARVMPDHDQNYHFVVKNLSYSAKNEIANQPWAQACYEILEYDDDGNLIRDDFRIRVTWDEVWRWGDRAWEIFDKYDMWDNRAYRSAYEYNYDYILEKLQKRYYNAEVVNGQPITTSAELATKREIVLKCGNTAFISDTINSYTFQPEFFGNLTVFGMFLAAVMAILSSERYKRQMREYGTLRALGLRRRQLIALHCTHTALSSVCAIPLAAGFTWGIVDLYLRLMGDLVHADPAAMTLTESIPLPIIGWCSLWMTVLSTVGSLVVCLLYRKFPVIVLLRGEGTFQVSFVSKTSPAFEDSPDLSVYNRLYLLRTRKSQIFSVAVIAIMMPLPLMYMGFLIDDVFELQYTDALVSFLYNLFQAIFIFITSVTVTVLASAGMTDERHAEFGIFRALGIKRKRLSDAVNAQSALRAIIVAVFAVVIFVIVTDSRLQSSAVTAPMEDTLPVFLAKCLLDLIGTAVFVFPSVFGGVRLSLRRFFRRPIIDALRDTE
ncbi:MAG: hypothetical protein IJW77_00300 [Clostridia bacterium]|nr:hypothetical protein [Clostridia bacterium]